MRAFDYAAPRTVEEAVGLLGDVPARAGGSAEILAGGTDLVGLMKDRVEAPGRLVDIKGIAALRGVHADGEGLRLGALVTLTELSRDAAVLRDLAPLAEAAGRLAAPQIRNRATLGGNLCQRPRCWYYRRGFGLLARQRERSLVVEGDNRYHAILGNGGPAYFVSPSTLAPLLIALGAHVQLVGPRGTRALPLAEFYRSPARDDEREYDRRPAELLTAVHVPSAGAKAVASYEVRAGEALDWSLATAAVALALEGERVRTARLVLGQVAPVPWASPEAERVLAGKPLDEKLATEAAAEVVAGARPLTRNGYKVQLARVAVKRALLAAAARGAAR